MLVLGFYYWAGVQWGKSVVQLTKKYVDAKNDLEDREATEIDTIYYTIKEELENQLQSQLKDTSIHQ